MNIRSNAIGLALFGLMSLGISGCSNFLEPTPENNISSEQVFTDEAGATAALTGAYGALTDISYWGGVYPIFADLAADNLIWNGSYQTWAQVKNRAIQSDNADVTNMWYDIYRVINRANNVIAYTPTVASIPDANKTQLIAQAQFLRAVALFDATRFWGDVPIVLTPTVEPGATLNVARSPQTQVYDQIKADLDAAEAVLPDASAGRATKWAAKALKARLALYRGDWQAASDLADQIIASGKFQLLSDYRAIWTTENSAESIWEIQFEATGNKSYEAFYMLPSTYGGRGEASTLGSTLTSAYETGDKRKDATLSNGNFTSTGTGTTKVTAGQEVKYWQANGEDNVRFIRYAEILLIGAEARAKLGKNADALVLLNQVRTRAGLAASTATSASTPTIQDVIANERRVELALEGHRWFDLVRTGKAQNANTLNITDPNKLLFPIPYREIQNNPNMKQNPGY